MGKGDRRQSFALFCIIKFQLSLAGNISFCDLAALSAQANFSCDCLQDDLYAEKYIGPIEFGNGDGFLLFRKLKAVRRL